MDGFKGLKKTPEQAVIILRDKKLQYVTASQIKSLFSTFKRQHEDGTLRPPTPPKSSTEERQNYSNDPSAEIGTEDISEEDGESDENDRVSELRGEIDEIIHSLDDWQVDDFVALRYETVWYPGKIIEMDDEMYLVSRMEYADNTSSTNKFHWPVPETLNKVGHRDILLKLDEPSFVSRGKRQGYFTFTDDDFNDAADILTMSLK